MNHHEDLMKNLYFPLIFFCDLCFYAPVQKFRLLDCCAVTCNNPGYDIERPGKYFFSIKFISESHMFVIIIKNNEYLSSILFLTF